jgi:hypothetical protein
LGWAFAAVDAQTAAIAAPARSAHLAAADGERRRDLM